MVTFTRAATNSLAEKLKSRLSKKDQIGAGKYFPRLYPDATGHGQLEGQDAD
jgi:ATP-dependent exoDNAse (exonuclease V) beta subunit